MSLGGGWAGGDQRFGGGGISQGSPPPVHYKNCGVLCPPNEQHTIGVISHRPLKVCVVGVLGRSTP